jgi:hypothetical protein
MTTSNLNQDALNTAVAAAAAARANVVARAEEIRQEAARIVAQQGDERRAFEVAAAANDRRHQDNLAVVGEEIEQLRGIVPEVFGDPAAQPVVPANAPVAPNGNGNAGDTQQQPAVTPAPAPARNGYNGVPQNQDQWIAAAIGAVIGFLVGLWTRGFLWTDHMFPSLSDPSTGHNLLAIIWVLAFAAFGFGLGGYIRYRFENRHHREH